MPRLETRPIDDVIRRLEGRGCHPDAAGPGQWRSRCPVHMGKSPNLSIREESDGTILLHCHHQENGRETCSAAAIADSLGLKLKDLFPAKPGENGHASRAARPAKKARADPARNGKGRAFPSAEAAIAGIARKLGRPTACWIYDEPHQGQRHELMRTYRFDYKDEDGKDKKQFRPVHPGSDGWHLGDPPGPLPLYNLPYLDTDHLVIVVEGEKCADLVKGLGLVATTSSHGAQAPEKTDWSPLAGKTVCIVPDHDEPGEGYAQAVGRLLWGLEPRPEIRILRTPGNPDTGDDIEQWLQDAVPDSWTAMDCSIELRRMADAAPPWSPPPADGGGKDGSREDQPKLTEWGMAKRLIRAFGDRLRFCLNRGIWLEWDGTRWDACAKGAIWRWAKETVRQLGQEAADEPDPERRTAIFRFAIKCESKKLMAATIDLAWSEPGISITTDQLDADGWLLNCPNGIVDLRTGALRGHRKEDLMSKITRAGFDPAAKCPRWREALNVIFNGDQSLIDYMQRALGYSLTGDIREHALFLCYGTGRNGKNTILDTVRTIMQDYATVASPRVFLSAGQGDHPAMLADLVGRRYVPTSEVDEGERLAESLVKRVTGDRTIKARFMNQNPFEFPVQFKLWMLANCKPEIHGLDEGIWSRIKVIPFDTFIPPEKRIPNLSDILVQEEGPGILGWLVEGCVAWQQSGLKEPARITDASKSYRAEQDLFGEFISQCCISHLGNEALREVARVKTHLVYGRYQEWCKQMGERNVMSHRKFSLELTRRGYPPKGENGANWRLGLELTTEYSTICAEKSEERSPY